MVARVVAIAYRLSVTNKAAESEKIEALFPEVCGCVESERDGMSIRTSSPFVARSHASRQGVQHHMNAKATLLSVHRHSPPLVSLAHLSVLCFFSKKAMSSPPYVIAKTQNADQDAARSSWLSRDCGRLAFPPRTRA
jgi:hypothetical protein